MWYDDCCINKPNIKESEKYEDKIYFVKDSGEKTWNRASPISARSCILQVKNILGEVNKAFVVYNSSDYMRFNSFDVESISKGFDSMILGFSYFVSEISKVFYEQGFGELIFVLLEDEEREKSILENVGLAAFSSLAESVANKKASKQLEISLVRGTAEVFERQKDVDEFWNNRKLNKYSNIQFGEGGFLRGFVDWIVQVVNETTDFNAGVVADGERTLDEAGADLLNLVLEVASGKQTKTERKGYREISIFKDGVVL